MIEIELSNSSDVALIDDEDLEKVSLFRWWKNGNYVSTRVKADGKNVTLYLHRLILSGHKLVDHKDRNPLNNQKYNLRPATRSQNGGNRRSLNGDKTKGISYRKDCGLWRASISLNGRKISLGSYNTAQEAMDVYDTAAIRHWGEFALTNAMLQKES